MNRSPRFFILGLTMYFLALSVWAGEDAARLYQKGMDAYLQGDYDQAILCAAKSLDIEPGYKKSKDLLSVLIVEKEQGEQTEIWLSGKQRIVPSVPKADPGLGSELTNLKTRVKSLEGRKGFNELEHRIKVVADLMEKTSNGQYQELRDAQVQTLHRLDSLVKDQSGIGINLFWLFVLVCLSLVLSLWAVIRRGSEKPRRLLGESE